MNTQLRFANLFILGAGHSGSTLVGRMISRNPRALFVGELFRLDAALKNAAELCSCGRVLHECPFWSRWLARLPDEVKRDFSNWNFDLFNQIRTDEGKDLLIDSSKTRAYRVTRSWKNSDVSYLLMVRDPRGALRGGLKRGGDLSIMLANHCKWMKRYEAFVRKKPSLVIYYEDLVTSPERQLEAICLFLGLDCSPSMFAPSIDTHLIRASASASKKKESSKLEFDDRWRKELSETQIAQIDAACRSIGLYQNRYDFSPPPPRRRSFFGRWGKA